MKVLKILFFIALTVSFMQAKSSTELAKETKTYKVSVADASGKTLYILNSEANIHISSTPGNELSAEAIIELGDMGEKNQTVFGLCNNPNFHGHNYELVVKVSGEPDINTGFVIDMKILSQIIKDNVLDKFDHKNLNLDTEEFKALNPTAENICVVIWKLIRAKLNSDLDLKVILQETERNSVEYAGN